MEIVKKTFKQHPTIIIKGLLQFTKLFSCGKTDLENTSIFRSVKGH